MIAKPIEAKWGECKSKSSTLAAKGKGRAAGPDQAQLLLLEKTVLEQFSVLSVPSPIPVEATTILYTIFIDPVHIFTIYRIC